MAGELIGTYILTHTAKPTIFTVFNCQTLLHRPPRTAQVSPLSILRSNRFRSPVILFRIFHIIRLDPLVALKHNPKHLPRPEHRFQLNRRRRGNHPPRRRHERLAKLRILCLSPGDHVVQRHDMHRQLEHQGLDSAAEPPVGLLVGLVWAFGYGGDAVVENVVELLVVGEVSLAAAGDAGDLGAVGKVKVVIEGFEEFALSLCQQGGCG